MSYDAITERHGCCDSRVCRCRPARHHLQIVVRPALELMRERGMDLGAESWSEKDFAAARLPMVVTCTPCGLTLPFAACYVDGKNRVWCGDCAEEACAS